MPHSLNPLSDEAEQWLDDAVALLRRPRDLTIDIPERNGGWSPLPGSQGERDFAERFLDDEEKNRGLVDLPRAVASLHLRDATEYLAGISALLAAREVHLGAPALGRSVFECAVRGFHVLDPRASPKQRLARMMLDNIAGAEEYRKATKHLAGESDPAFVEADAQWRRWKDRATEVFQDEAELGGGSSGWLLHGERYPRMNEGARSWMEWHNDRHKVEGGLTGDQIEGIYDFLCLYTHPQSFTGHQVARGPEFHTDIVELARMVVIPLWCAIDLARLVWRYHGWDVPEVAEMDRAADELFR